MGPHNKNTQPLANRNAAARTMSGPVEIKTLADYDTAVQNGKACAFFWAAWHEPSKPGGQMDEVSYRVVDLQPCNHAVCSRLEARHAVDYLQYHILISTASFVEHTNTRGDL